MRKVRITRMPVTRILRVLGTDVETSGCPAFVMMVQTAYFGDLEHSTFDRQLRFPFFRCIFSEPIMVAVTILG